MMLPIFDVASSAARRTLRTQNRVIPRLRGHDLLLHATQKLLRLGERQSQVANLPKIAAGVDLHDVNVPSRPLCARLDQPQHPPHPRCPTQH